MQGQDLLMSEQPRRKQLAWAATHPADVGVATFKRWLATKGGGGPFSESRKEGAQPAATEDRWNRWEVHGKHCPTCQRGLLQLDRAAKTLGQTSLLFSAFAAVLAVSRRESNKM